MIATKEALHALVERSLEAEAVALDTEFVWERTYYPRLGVVQLALGPDDAHLIDAAALDLEPLGRLLAAPEVVKILHDAQQDLVILRRATGAAPRNIFDTRRAAGFVGLPATLSLGDLVRRITGTRLPKTESRTDWLRRPLSEKQYEYALDDVRYLHEIRAALREQAEARGRTAWLEEELATYDDPALYADPDPRTQYRRLSGAGNLPARRLSVLRELAAWREEEARRRDLPRGHVIDDKALGAIARRLPQTREALGAINGVGGATLRRYTEPLLQTIAHALELPTDDLPHRPRRDAPDDTLAPRVNLALACLAGRGLAEGVDPALVAPRAEVTALVAAAPDADPDDHALLRGWRRAFLGADLLALLAGDGAVRVDPETRLPLLGRNEENRP